MYGYNFGNRLARSCSEFNFNNKQFALSFKQKVGGITKGLAAKFSCMQMLFVSLLLMEYIVVCTCLSYGDICTFGRETCFVNKDKRDEIRIKLHRSRAVDLRTWKILLYFPRITSYDGVTHVSENGNPRTMGNCRVGLNSREPY